MNLYLKLKKVGEKRNWNYNLIILNKTQGINSRYVDKIGHSIKKESNLVFIDNNKLSYWLFKGCKIKSKKLQKWLKFFYV